MYLFTDKDMQINIIDSTSGELKIRETPALLSDSAFPHAASLTYYFDGKDIIHEGDKQYIFTKDTLRISPAPMYDTHNAAALTVEKGNYITISFECHPPLVNEIIFADVSAENKIKELFLEFHTVNKRKKNNYIFKLNSIFYELLYEIFKFLNHMNEPKRFQKLEPALSYIHTHYYDTNFQCGSLPEICGIKYAYFNRLFAEKFGMPPSKYVTQLRMELAANLLNDKNADIEETALNTGYDTLSYFSQVFKKYYGVAPSHYKNHSESSKQNYTLPYFNKKELKLCELLRYHEISRITDLNTLPSIHQNSQIIAFSDDASFGSTSAICFKKRFFAAWDREGKIFVSHGDVISEIQGNNLANPYFGTDCDSLFMFANETNGGEAEAVIIYLYNEETQNFEPLKQIPLHFKLTGNILKPISGRLMLPGAANKENGEIPSVLLSDSGRIDGEWRQTGVWLECHISKDNEFENTAISGIVHKSSTFLFCTNSVSRVPTMYTGVNHDEWWNEPEIVNLPILHSRVWAGTLGSKKNYLFGSIYPGNSNLALFVSEPDILLFTKGFFLQNEKRRNTNAEYDLFRSPSAAEIDGKLYCVYIAENSKTGASAIVRAEILEKL